MRPHVTHVRSLVLAALACAPLAGCLVSGSSDQQISGSMVSKDVFSQVEPGKTTAKWVQAAFGEPDTRETLDDGTEVWRWAYTQHKQSGGSVLFLVHSSNKSVTKGSTVVEFKDGIVTKAWQD